MSTAQVSYDEYSFQSPRSPHQFELSLAPGPSQASPLYPRGFSHLETSASGNHVSRHLHHIPVDPAYSSFIPEQHGPYSTQYHLAGADVPYVDAQAPHFPPMARPASPRSLYTAASGFAGPDGYGGFYHPSSSVTFLQNLQSVIESSHTAQSHHLPNITPAGVQPSSGPSQSSWTLSGSLDPTTGVFQRSVEHPRLRTAQACEKCRIRKAKCSGEHPCKRCVSRDLHCEYAPERKMRGPNKHKRKHIGPQKATGTSPASPRTKNSGGSATSSDSESPASDQQADSPPSVVISYTPVRSSHNSPTPASLASPSTSQDRLTRLAASQDPSEMFSDTSEIPGVERRDSLSRPRPPPLDLSVAREMYPRMLAEYARNAEHTPFPVDVSDVRRTSLPSYLMESYSRIALQNVDDGSAEPSAPGNRSISQDMSTFMHASPVDALSTFQSHVPASSTPITPLSLAYDGTGDLLYPEPSSAFSSDHAFGHFGIVASPVAMYDPEGEAFAVKGVQDSSEDGWDVAALQSRMMDDDTPRAINESVNEMASIEAPN